MRHPRLRKSGIAVAAAALLVGITLNYASPPGDPLDGEARVNTATAGFQGNAAVARDADGDYVVVWSGAGTGDGSGIFLQRYDRHGVAQGSERRVNTTTAELQRLPAVAMDAAGNFVVAWESNLQDGDGYGIYAQRFAADGSTQGGEFPVNGYTASDQTQASVAMAADGSFVIAWRSLLQDGSGQGIYAQRYDSAGAAAGGEFRANTYTANSQSNPAVAMQPNGDFLIAWDSNGQEGSGLGQGIYLQRYSASGVTLGAETHVNSTSAGNQYLPAVAIDASGNYAVGWQGPDASGLGVYLQRYDASGVAFGGEVALNTQTAGDQGDLSLALDAHGRFAAVWSSGDADGLGIVLQRTDGVSTALAAETAVNSTTADVQRKPAVAVDADGDIVVAWESNLQDGNGYAVIARRFVGAEDVDLALTLTDSPDPQQINGSISYQFKVQNQHPVSTATGVAALDAAFGAAGGVVVSTEVPAGASYSSASGTDWSCNNTNGKVDCTLAKALAAGASSTVTVNLTAGLNAAMLDLQGSVAADQYDSVSANNSASESTAVCGIGQTNPGTLQFSAASSSVAESGGQATITVTRSGGSCGVVSVNYATADGSARDGTPDSEAQDFSARSGTLTWGSGDSASKTFTVPVTDDALNEATETVNLSLSLPADAERGSLGTQRTATLSVTDNDAQPSVTLQSSTASLAEDGGSATLTATLSEVSGQDVTVNLAFSGSATASDDYARSASSLVIAAGQRSASVTVSAVNDTRDEDEETVVVDISSVTNGSESGTQQLSLGIVDDDEPPTVQFSASSSTVAEGVVHEVTVQLSAVSGRDVSVSFEASGSASGADYSLDAAPSVAGNQGSPITLPANGSGSATVRLTLTDDALDEAPEDIVLTLTGASNASLGTTTVRTVTITDNDDAPTVAFTATSQTVAEGDTGTSAVTVTARLSAVSGQDVTAPFSVGGSARNPQDHDAAAGSIVIPAGAQEASTSFQVANDTLDDADTETAVLTLTSPTHATLGSNTSHTVSISDNDSAPSLRFAVASQSAAEDVADGTASIVVQLSGESGRAVTVPFSVSGSASQDSDYGISSSPVTIPQGSTEAVITVSLRNDVDAEDDETVIATLAAPSDGSATLGSPDRHTLTIVDNDAVPQISFASGSQSVIENVMLGTATITVQLSRASSDDITLPYSVAMMSTADAGDYKILSDNPLIIPAGSTSADIVVSVSDDASDEQDQTVVVVMGTPHNATAQAPTSHTLTILDDDDAPELRFVPATQEVNEGSAVTVTVAPAVVSEKPISVSYSVGGSAAGGGADHDAEGGSLSLPAGASSVSFHFNATNDAVDEANENVVFSLADPVNGRLGSNSSHVATIVDDDAAPEVTLSLSDSALAENAGRSVVTATLSAASERDVTVQLGFNGGAKADADYTRSATSIVIAAGNRQGSLTLAAQDDALDELDEAINVAVSTVENGVEASEQKVTATITDDDAAPTVNLSLSGGPMAEAGGQATVTATLSAVSARQVTVNLGFAGGAVRGTDYSSSATRIVIPAGASSASITLGALQDEPDEANEGLTVSMGTVYNASKGSAQKVTTTITDDDPLPRVVLELADGAMAENGGVATVTARLSAASGRVVTINLAYAGSASNGSDYTASAARITIPAGATTGTVTLSATDDSSVEGSETIVVDLAKATNAAESSPQKATATISDND